MEIGSDVAVTNAQLQELAPEIEEQEIRTQHADRQKLGHLLAFLDHYSVLLGSEPREVPKGERNVHLPGQRKCPLLRIVDLLDISRRVLGPTTQIRP